MRFARILRCYILGLYFYVFTFVDLCIYILSNFIFPPVAAIFSQMCFSLTMRVFEASSVIRGQRPLERWLIIFRTTRTISALLVSVIRGSITMASAC